MPAPAVQRTFEVDAPPLHAWERLIAVRRWPDWAPHILAVTVLADGPIGPTTRGALRIKGFGRTTFRMSERDPPHRWEWVGGPLGLRIRYDHRFEEIRSARTRLVWQVYLEGPLGVLVRPTFKRLYGHNVDRAIPHLKEWITR
ncbi:MAG: SRPBCC family protein [Acidimicrobiales bacterium]